MKRKSLLCILALWLFSSQALKAQLETSNLVITDGIRNEMIKKAIEKNVSLFLTACNTAVLKGGKPDLDKKSITGDGRKRFMEIWTGSPIALSVSMLERNCIIRPTGGYQIRNIPVTMYEAPEAEQKQEIVINLTADGRIDDVFIPITQYTDLLRTNMEMEDIDLRLVVLEFVENFRTAYNRKDIGFIGTVFSENAIIITGKEIKQKSKSDMALRNSLSTAQFEYQVRTKKEYITHLTGIFKRNKYISIKFDDIVIVRHPKPEYPVYGVTLKQDWCSGNYANCEDSPNYRDNGYVFLLINFEDKTHPLITVRTWQPQKYGDRDIRDDEKYQMGDFIK
jgi:hypothetical protein